MKAKMDEQITEKSEKTKKMFFERKNEQESDQNGRCKKETKKSRMKKRRQEKGRNMIKGRHPQHFQKMRYFSKIKRCEKKKRYRN